jgi:hypothetical protein
VFPLVVDPAVVEPVPGVRKPAVPPVELTGGVMTTVEPVVVPVVPVVPAVPGAPGVTTVVPVVEPVVPVVPLVVPRAAGTPPAVPAPPGRRQVTSRSEQKAGIVVRSVDASAA